MVMKSEEFTEKLKTHLEQELRNYDEYKGRPLYINHEDFSSGTLLYHICYATSVFHWPRRLACAMFIVLKRAFLMELAY